MKDELLDEAIEALRGEDEAVSREREEATLAAILATLDREALLDEAVSAYREETELAPHEAASLQAIEAALRGQGDGSAPTGEKPAPRRRAVVAWHWAWAAALLVSFIVPTAYAWSTGQLREWLVSMGVIEEPLESARLEPASSTTARGGARLETVASPDLEPESPSPPELPSEDPESPSPSVLPADERSIGGDGEAGSARPEPAPRAPGPATRPRSVRRVPAPPVRASSSPEAEGPLPERSPAQEASRPDDPETQAFALAHRAHFGGGAAAAALDAWDTYLRAYPSGRYELEARYNRALVLVRLGRLAAAREALAPFASGARGGYRRSDAERLIEAIDRRLANEAGER